MKKINNLFKKNLILSVVMFSLCCGLSYAQNNNQSVVLPTVNYLPIESPVLLSSSPGSFLGKNVMFQGKFSSFSSLGLDYKPINRKSSDYIGLLIFRDDVGENKIPLSELKMFMKLTDAQKYTDLNTGDKIEVKGKIFSDALGDAWLDVEELKNLTPKKQTEENQSKE